VLTLTDFAAADTLTSVVDGDMAQAPISLLAG
jgi:hypothetical protein